VAKDYCQFELYGDSIDISSSDKPKFNCTNEVLVKNTTKTLTLQCTGFSNPPISEAYWDFTVSGIRYTLPYNETKGDFKAQYEVSHSLAFNIFLRIVSSFSASMYLTAWCCRFIDHAALL
jgi:hypothetical protein